MKVKIGADKNEKIVAAKSNPELGVTGIKRAR